MTTIGISEFIKVNTNKSIFDGDWNEVHRRVWNNFKQGVKGYREGVLLVPISPEGFFCPVIKLERGHRFVGQYDSRVPEEEPRKKLWKYGTLPPAGHVNVILYHKEVLLETHESTTGADWDMIAVQALFAEDVGKAIPMDPTTLMYNHFQLSGGTSTKMTAEEFESALRESLLYWKNKILVVDKTKNR